MSFGSRARIVVRPVRAFPALPNRQLATSSTYQASPTSPRRSPILTATLIGLLGGSCYLLGSLYPPSLIALAFPAPALPAASRDSPEGKAHTASIEAAIQSLALVKKLKSSASPVLGPEKGDSHVSGANPATVIPAKEEEGSEQLMAHYSLSRPYAQFPPNKAQHSLTAGSLRGPGMVAVPPLVLSLTSHGAANLGGTKGDAYAFIHLGRSVCGHDGLIHGGLLATVLDETLARTAFYSLPKRIGVTAHLEMDYRRPVKADQFVVIQTRMIDAEGRKARIEGIMRDLDGNILVESKALFVQPKGVAFLDTSAVKAVMDQKDEN